MQCCRGIGGIRCYHRRLSSIIGSLTSPSPFARPRCTLFASAVQRQYASSTLPTPLASWYSKLDTAAFPDTIYALSSAPGRAAIAVVRISGSACLDVYRRLCPKKPDPKPRTATLRKLYDPDESLRPHSRILDNGALVLYFPAPKTVTGEDILELHVHGGPAIVRSVLEGISKCGRTGQDIEHLLRHADPGEFTKRAFYNGKLDLTQAEALGETLAAETEQQRRLAVSGAESGLAKRYKEWRTMLLNARGELEALIDFSEDQHFDESPVDFMRSVTSQIQVLKSQIDVHLQNASKGELLRNGITIALLGAPNAGKSSLLNRVVGREAAIVSAEEGTTRDIVDVTVDIDGWLCRLGDMAGLRGVGTSSDHKQEVGFVEREGIRRARERALQSDVVVVLLSLEIQADGSVTVPVNREVVEAVQECQSAGKAILIALNKVDMIDGQSSSKHVYHDIRDTIKKHFPLIPNERISLISCKAALDQNPTGSDPGGVQAFLAQLTNIFNDLTTASTGGTVESMTPAEQQAYWTASLSVTHRQGSYLKECRQHLNDYLGDGPSAVETAEHMHGYHVDRRDDLIGPVGSALGDEFDIVMAAEHLRFAALCLAKITGKGEGGDVEDVLGVVFEK